MKRYTLLLFSTLSIFLANCLNAKGQDITTGLVAHYDFESISTGVLDIAGSHDGTNYGAELTTEGKIGNALIFDGTDYVRVYNNSDITGYDEFTLTAWIFPTSVGVNRVILAKVSSGRDFVIKLHHTTKFSAEFYDGAYKMCFSDSLAQTGQWIHVAATWKDYQWKIYYNGVLQSTCTFTGYEPPWISQSMYIGALSSSSERFVGKIDEVRIYNRALSSSDISALCSYNGGTTDTTLWAINGTNIYNTNTGNVGIGTSSPDEKLTVNGTILSKEVIIDLDFDAPDYVFENDHKLLSISELQSFIIKNNHLPEFPPALEMETKGISVSEINMGLLKRIEELTLYIIDQEKRIQGIEKQHNTENK